MALVAAQEAVVAIAQRLMRDIVHALTRDGVGARTLRLALYRVDGGTRTIDIALTRPTRSVPHVARPGTCPRCLGQHDLTSLPADYVYLLGLYLGDGCLSRHRRSAPHLPRRSPRPPR